MTKPIWVLETKVFAEVCFDAMVAHLTASGIEHHLVRVLPMTSDGGRKAPEIEGKTPVIPAGAPVVVYGSVGVQALARQHGWTPGVWTDHENFNYETFRDKLGDLLLNADMHRMPLSAAGAYFAGLDPLDKRFIKPNLDTKEFAGQVITAADFDVWLAGMIDTGYLTKDSDFDVVIAAPKDLGVEWRAVVVDGKVSSCCIYRQWQRVMPELHILPEVEDLILQAHAKFAPGDVYVIDIAQEYRVIDGQRDYVFKIIEYNTFNSAGLYACDVIRIIDDINAFLERSHP